MNYIIYGANSAIGSQLARVVLPSVERLFLFYHKNTDRIEDLLGEPKVVAMQSDVQEYEDLVGKVSEVFSQLPVSNNPLSIVYLPAIRSHDYQPLAQTSLDLTKEIIDVNLLGAIHFLKAMLSLKPNTRHPKPNIRIVLLGSNVSRTGLCNGSVYAATKAALANLVRSVAMEEGCNGVLINTVSPGPVETENAGFTNEYARFRKEYFETQRAKTSLNKLASVDEVCAVIRFLTSEENTHITGEEIFITGGAL